MTGKQKILIVDDDRNLRKTLSDILKAEGYEGITAGCGAEGIAAVKAGGVNVALVDLMLPDLSGLEVLSEVKRRCPSIEVIVLTGYATLEAAIEKLERRELMAKLDAAQVPVGPVNDVAEISTARWVDGADAVMAESSNVLSVSVNNHAQMIIFDQERSRSPSRARPALGRSSGPRADWHSPAIRRPNRARCPRAPPASSPRYLASLECTSRHCLNRRYRRPEATPRRHDP